MPAVSRKGDSLTTGHICITTTTLATPSQDTVYAVGKLVARIDDLTVAHPYPPSPPCANHTSTVKAGSATVFCEGKKVARVTDSADLGALTSGAGTVFAGD